MEENKYFIKYAKSVVKKYEAMQEEYEFCKAYLNNQQQPTAMQQIAAAFNPIQLPDKNNQPDCSGYHEMQIKMSQESFDRIYAFGNITTLDFTDGKIYQAITKDNIECTIVNEYQKYCWEVKIDDKIKVISKDKIRVL